MPNRRDLRDPVWWLLLAWSYLIFAQRWLALRLRGHW